MGTQYDDNRPFMSQVLQQMQFFDIVSVIVIYNCLYRRVSRRMNLVQCLFQSVRHHSENDSTMCRWPVSSVRARLQQMPTVWNTKNHPSANITEGCRQATHIVNPSQQWMGPSAKLRHSTWSSRKHRASHSFYALIFVWLKKAFVFDTNGCDIRWRKLAQVCRFRNEFSACPEFRQFHVKLAVTCKR